ncbi:type IV pilin protein [Deinococcus radiopugnans]|uniref:type IV pilin protein n=1 Tax=Deinococcus radiopugnans TaxID=57497 RepID=UPI0023ED1142|nr:type II secretion system protein [Deinococcus radiopugnans]
MKNNTQGFTLIELLIVIAIIGILAAVLLPNLLGARKRANDIAAQSYLREAQTQQEIYNTDNNAYLNTAASIAPGATLAGLPDLKKAPANVTLTIAPGTPPTGVAANSWYIMTAKNSTGTKNYCAYPSGTTSVPLASTCPAAP